MRCDSIADVMRIRLGNMVGTSWVRSNADKLADLPTNGVGVAALLAVVSKNAARASTRPVLHACTHRSSVVPSSASCGTHAMRPCASCAVMHVCSAKLYARV